MTYLNYYSTGDSKQPRYNNNFIPLKHLYTYIKAAFLPPVKASAYLHAIPLSNVFRILGGVHKKLPILKLWFYSTGFYSFCSIGSGTIEFKEFVDLLAPTLKDQEKNQEELREAFKVFDKNGKTISVCVAR